MLLITDRPHEFLQAWDRPPSPDYAPNIHRVSEVKRGGTVGAMILFAQCTPESMGRCKSVVDFTVRRPDGSVYAENRAIPLWNEPPPPPTSLQLGNAHLMFEVEQTDPLGTYQIEAAVRDEVAGRRIALLQRLVVHE
jgi:hypothetical protein